MVYAKSLLPVNYKGVNMNYKVKLSKCIFPIAFTDKKEAFILDLIDLMHKYEVTSIYQNWSKPGMLTVTIIEPDIFVINNLVLRVK